MMSVAGFNRTDIVLTNSLSFKKRSLAVFLLVDRDKYFKWCLNATDFHIYQFLNKKSQRISFKCFGYVFLVFITYFLAQYIMYLKSGINSQTFTLGFL